MGTLNERQIGCPDCETALTVPTGCGGRIVRCGKCGQRFRLPEEELPSEDDIASWLGEEAGEGIGLAQSL
jgi:transcription elongation factor Elf1